MRVMSRKNVLRWVIFFCLTAGILQTRGENHYSEGWNKIKVPGGWNQGEVQDFIGYTGFAWYHTYVFIPQEWEGRRIFFSVGKVDSIEETFFNKEKIGAFGSMPPLLRDPASSIRRPYLIEPDMVFAGSWNLLSMRIYNKEGDGGISKGPIQLSSGDQAIDLAGNWAIYRGDLSTLNNWPVDIDNKSEREDVFKTFNKTFEILTPQPFTEVDYAGRSQSIQAAKNLYKNNSNVHSNTDGKGPPLNIEETIKKLKIPDFLNIQIALSEPECLQPLYTEFDEKGRLWVTQYIQYPEPAGIELIAWDRHLRAIYDQDPPPPPFDTPEKAKFKGRDKITIHEDTNGDGRFDTHKVFMDGLNIATSTAQDKEGVWVLNPPYLLFVPDKNKDDIPDGRPVVHLSGFGLEDTHSVANSLKLGPDGWLYGVTGSTVTARVKVHFDPSFKPLKFFGQTVWRYNPRDFRFELFAEGGWNNFGLEFDDQGRLFSGTNGGMQAVYFYQGGYYQKNFGKHGPHNNPFAFDYLGGLKLEGDTRRMVHQWIIYGGHTIPEYKEKLIGVNPLANLVMTLERTGKGSSFTTREFHKTIQTDHKWFRPIHITTGPDGALYISDFYDARITHLDPRDNWDRDHGRVYRVYSKTSPTTNFADLGKLTSKQLLTYLSHENKWHRDTARRLLIEKQDPTIRDHLITLLLNKEEQTSLEALWVLHGLDVMNEALWISAMAHKYSPTRMWAIRLLGDRTDFMTQSLKNEWGFHAATEKNYEVVTQLLCSAKRKSPEINNSVLRQILEREELRHDQTIRCFTWWAAETSFSQDPLKFLQLLEDQGFYNESPFFRDSIFQNLVRRTIADPTHDNLIYLSRLLTGVKDKVLLSKAVAGIEQSLQGQSIREIPEQLSGRLQSLTTQFPNDINILKLGIKLGDPTSEGLVQQVVNFIKDESTANEQRVQILNSVSHVSSPLLESHCIEIISGIQNFESLRLSALSYLRLFPQDRFADIFIHLLVDADPLQQQLIEALAGYEPWTEKMILALEKKVIDRNLVDFQNLTVLKRNLNPSLKKRFNQIWSKANNGEVVPDMTQRVRMAVNLPNTSLERGRKIFIQYCASCHKLNNVGTLLGPDLTGYERDDLDYLMTSIIQPNLAIREGFELASIKTKRSGDTKGPIAEVGSIYSGFVENETKANVTLRELGGQLRTIPKATILDMSKSQISLMPEGLLSPLSNQEIADLFRFLQN